MALAIMLVVVVGRAEPGRQCARAVPRWCAARPGTSRSCQPPWSTAPSRRSGASPAYAGEGRAKSGAPTRSPTGRACAGPQQPVEPDIPIGDLKPLNTQAQALVMSVVDERTLAPVTRSRLTLRIQPTDGEAFEVTTRVAFPTPEERAADKGRENNRRPLRLRGPPSGRGRP